MSPEPTIVRTALRSLATGFATSLVIWFTLFYACSHIDPGFHEEQRATSPDGKFDAVEISDLWGGAWGGVDLYVFIVPRGSRVPPHVVCADEPVLYATRLSDEHLVWKSARELDLSYDIARIEQFRNHWDSGELGKHNPCERDACVVEIQLAPKSDYSAVTPEGAYRSQ
jgi:hypothetical protein